MRSFDTLNLSGHVPLKLGHEGPDARDDPTSQFALGWVTRVYREGRKLLADFSVPDKVAEIVKEGFLKFVSVELLRDVKADTREIPWVLDAVALLGADQPAVGILNSLTMARSAGLQCRERVAFTRDPHHIGDRSAMADKDGNDDIKAILSRLDAAEKERDALKLTAARVEQSERKLQEFQSQTQAEKTAAHRAKILELFEAAIKDKKIVPATRERFKRAYKFDADGIVDVTLTDVESFIKDNPNPDAPKKVVGLIAGGGELAPDARVDEKVVHLARKYIRDNASDPRLSKMPHWQQLHFAAQEVLKADPELGRDYKAMPTTVSAVAAGGS